MPFVEGIPETLGHISVMTSSRQHSLYKHMPGNGWFLSLIEILHSTINTLAV
jgi:hypothetical protein